ncbi:MAG: type IX secretion system sortase PorU [Bacteroidales bacterium]|nr:type IX secretion system sortase PorU [Bacteroidales bacterium]
MRANNTLLHLVGALLLVFASAPSVLAQKTEFVQHSMLASGSWYKFPISQTGVYQITSSDIPSLNGTPCRQIALMGAPGGMLPISNKAHQTDDLSPIPIEILDANGNGIFDPEDRLVFFAESPNVWRFNSQKSQFEYAVHAYANSNYYFLTTQLPESIEHTRISDTSLTVSANYEINTYTAVATYHVDNINTHGGGQIWVADKFTSSLSSRSYTIEMPAPSSSNQIAVRYAFAHISDYSATLSLQCGSESRQQSFTNYNTYLTFYETFAAPSGNNVSFTINYRPNESKASGYLDYIEVSTQTPLVFSGNELIFRNSQQLYEGNVRRFNVRGNSNGIRIWDVTNVNQAYSLPIENASSSTFSFLAPTDKARTFVAFIPTEAPHPGGIVSVDNQDLHGSHLPDYVIVSHPEFLEQAQRLADIHSQHDGFNVLVTTEEQVYNEYSSGMSDPVAIRRMMRQMRSKDTSGINPRYLLLFGKGTYDNRDLLGLHQQTVITYQTPASFDSEGSAHPSDDIYGYLSDEVSGAFEGAMTVSIGRLPAKSKSEATHLVNKIDSYINRSDFAHNDIRGDWRNYVALLADDADPSCSGDTNFASDSEIMARRIRQKYPQINIDRIYADSYIQQSGADGSYYPDVNNALRQRINYGCLLLNYIGHGSSSYIGTERYMEFSDIEKYTNNDRLTFFITSTCSFGHYDHAGDICGAEQFLLADAAGIGIISAARPIHHNQRFNTNTCLFSLDPNNTIGDALRLAKNATSVSHCIALLGDPALRLSIPRNQVVVTKINNRAIDTAIIDSVEVLSKVTIEGEIRDAGGSLLTDFNGTIYPIVYDREVACRTLANDNDSTEIDFVQQKNVLFKGRETVRGGRFEYSFIVPRDVSYHYDYAKLSHYARSESDDATGQYGNIMFGGFNEQMEITELHPTVELFIGDSTFRSGSITNETPTIFARLRDSVGINAAGSGLGHDITATIDGNPYSTVTLNDYYQPNIRDSRGGEITYTLGKLENGRHTLTLKCWNIFNYSGSATIDFVVANDKLVQIGQMTSAPNPANDHTTIRIEHNMPAVLQHATVDIFDIRGNRVRQFFTQPADNSCVVAIPWNFTSESGALVPKGIYIARATLIATDGTLITQTCKIIRN